MKRKKFPVENPELLVEWDFEKNSAKNWSPEDFTNDSWMRVWWKCILGHSWRASIVDRVNGAGCPYDSGKRKLFDNLASMRLNFLAEWDYEARENMHLYPEEIQPCSCITVGWRCIKGHRFKMRVVDRHRGIDCPMCRKRRLANGFTNGQ